MSKRKTILWLAVILWMILIFILSAQPVEKSNNLSKGVTEIVIDKVAPNKNVNKSRMNHLFRKNAHFFAYFALGILVSKTLKCSGVYGFKGIALALLICVLYAISDEVHQLFVPGRGGQVKDVLIDSAGSIVGIGLYNLKQF